MPTFEIVHHGHGIKDGVVMACVEAKTAGDALSLDRLGLPQWTVSCSIQEQSDGTAVIEHPHELGHYIVATPEGKQVDAKTTTYK